MKIDTDMKKGLIIFTLLMTLGMSVPTMAQKHRHTPRGTELVDTTKQTSAVDAFSDTTSVDSASSYSYSSHGVNIQWDSDEEFGEAVGKMFETISKDTSLATGLIIAVVAIIVIFLVAPILILLLIFYFVNKNRKQKIKLAQMAMQNGQPIPEQLLEKPQVELDDEYQKGLRQCFVGVGLAIFLGYAAGEIGFGIGALVFFIGLGKVIAAKTAAKKEKKDNELNHEMDQI